MQEVPSLPIIPPQVSSRFRQQERNLQSRSLTMGISLNYSILLLQPVSFQIRSVLAHIPMLTDVSFHMMGQNCMARTAFPPTRSKAVLFNGIYVPAHLQRL